MKKLLSIVTTVALLTIGGVAGTKASQVEGEVWGKGTITVEEGEQSGVEVSTDGINWVTTSMDLFGDRTINRDNSSTVTLYIRRVGGTPMPEPSYQIRASGITDIGVGDQVNMVVTQHSSGTNGPIYNMDTLTNLQNGTLGFTLDQFIDGHCMTEIEITFFSSTEATGGTTGYTLVIEDAPVPI